MKLAYLVDPWITDNCYYDIEILGLENDSRRVKQGYLFLAYPGSTVDGRLFIDQASNAGAAAILYEPAFMPASMKFPTNIPCLPLPDLGNHLAAIASRFHNNPSTKLHIIGVTGTNGKTTVALQLAQAYDLLGQSAAYIGTIGQGSVNHLKPLANTTPDGLLSQQLLARFLQEGKKQICMEVSSHALVQHRVDHIQFTQAIYTNLSHDHLDYHQTMEKYAAAKALLFKKPELRSVIVNHDDAYTDQMVRQVNNRCTVIRYGFAADSDVRVLDWHSTMLGSRCEIHSPWGQHQLRINSLGKFNLYNSLAIYTSLMANGFDANKVIDVMATLQAAPGRMEVISNEPCVIVDYAHTPDALENVLMTLRALTTGRLYVVFGCGGDRDKTKRAMMGRVAAQYSDVVIITSDNPRSEDPRKIIDDVCSGITNQLPLKIIDRRQAIMEALNLAQIGDIILVAGKGHEAYQQVGDHRFHFSDQEVIRHLLF
ncbi:MAG: UDP-N-acetylmuramoyl-L-alanyl-D-glutamate--2,6-diaminopimelate ligase [Legionella sp.]